MARAVGIDFGTANCVVSVLEGGEPTVVANAEGARVTPTVVASGPDLRGARYLLRQLDPRSRYGGLHRVQATSGEFLWVCPEHATAYDPGLPTFVAE